MKVLQIKHGQITLSLSVDDALVLSRACDTAADGLVDQHAVEEAVALEVLQTAFTALAAAGSAQMHVAPQEQPYFRRYLNLFIATPAP